MGDLVLLEVVDGVGVITLNRPPMNALNEELTRDLLDVTIEVSRREDVGAVVIWGGEKVFAAGADVKMMAEMVTTIVSASRSPMMSATGSP